MTSRRRLLVVSPAFHGYWRSIERAFSQIGYETGTCRFDERTWGGKARHKLAVELPGRIGLAPDGGLEAEFTARAVQSVHEFRPDIVLAVKGDLLGHAFHEAIRSVGARSAVWIYDELSNTRFTPERVTAFGGVASYSGKDVETLRSQGHEALFVMDAFDPDLPQHRRFTREIVQIGALYPARQTALEALQEAGLPVRSYGREWSRHPIDFLRTWGSRRPPVPSGREMSRGEAMGLMGGAPAALNIHGTHDGFNMRTFEAAGAGAVQLIDRTDLAGVYEPGTEILPYTSHDELIELAERCIRDDRWGDRLREAARARTLAEHTFVHRARQLEALWA